MANDRVDDIMMIEENEADSVAIAARAAAIARFAVGFAFLVVGMLAIGNGVGMQDSEGIWWYVGGILGVSAGFAVVLGARD